MRRIARLSFGALLFTLATATAQGGFIYRESVDGDLPLPDLGPPQTAPPFTLLPFSLGTNSIIGYAGLHSINGQDPLNDKDPFTFVIPAGTYLKFATITYDTTLLGPGVTEAISTYYLAPGDYVDETVLPIDVAGVDLVTSESPKALWSDVNGGMLGPGTYSVLQSYTIGGPGVHQGASLVAFNYEINFEVVSGDLPPPPATVPAPGGAILFGIGVAGLALALSALNYSPQRGSAARITGP